MVFKIDAFCVSLKEKIPNKSVSVEEFLFKYQYTAAFPKFGLCFTEFHIIFQTECPKILRKDDGKCPW